MNYTDSGYRGNENLKAPGSTFEYEDWQFEEILKCKKDPIYFIENYLKVIHQDYGEVPLKLYDFQKEMVTTIHENRRVIGRSSRQSGKTTSTASYLVHFIIFNSNKNALILANKAENAYEVLTRVKNMYLCLPIWLQQGIVKWNVTSIELENGSTVRAQATSASAGRSKSISFLMLDEFAFIPPGLFEQFFASVYPVVSSSKTAKIVMISTPNGLNHFYKMYTEAVEGKNGYAHFTYRWNDVPGRDRAWADKEISEVGSRRFNQEYEVEFLGSSNTLLEPHTLEGLHHKPHIATQFDEKLLIYQQPDESRKYVMFTDVAEGKGQDYSTIQVIDVTELPYKQAAVFRDNKIRENVFHYYVDKVGKLYNNALAVIESNSIGSTVNNFLNYDTEYENIFYNDKDFGLRTSKKTKSLGCQYFKDFMEKYQLEIVDYNTINELSTFVSKRNSYSAEDGKHDDLVMPLVLFSYFMNDKEVCDTWIDRPTVTNDHYSEYISELENEIMPCFIVDSANEYEDWEI